MGKKNIYIYKYLFWAKYPPFYAPDQEKKNLKFFYAPYGLKEYRCKVSTIYLYYYKSYYKLQETVLPLGRKIQYGNLKKEYILYLRSPSSLQYITSITPCLRLNFTTQISAGIYIPESV